MAQTWTHRLPESTNTDFAIGADNSIYALGRGKDTWVLPDTTLINLAKVSSSGLTISKFDSMGSFQWVYPFVGRISSDGTRLPAMTANSIGQSFFGGAVYDTLLFGPDSLVAYTDIDQLVLGSVTPDGQYAWLAKADTSIHWNSRVSDVAIDKDGHILAACIGSLRLFGPHDTININHENAVLRMDVQGHVLDVIPALAEYLGVDGQGNWYTARGAVISKYSPADSLLWTINASTWAEPFAVDLQGNCFAAMEEETVEIYDTDGNLTGVANPPAKFIRSIAAAHDGTFYVGSNRGFPDPNYRPATIERFDLQGNYLSEALFGNTLNSQILARALPYNLLVDQSSHLLVSGNLGSSTGTTQYFPADTFYVGGGGVWLGRYSPTSFQPNAIPEPEAPLALEVFPNPFSVQIQVRSAAPLGPIKLRLYDINGRVVYRKRLPASTLQHQLELPNLPAGAYVLHARAGKQVFTQQVVRQ